MLRVGSGGQKHPYFEGFVVNVFWLPVGQGYLSLLHYRLF